MITAYRQLGTYRGAAEMCGVTPKTVRRIIERSEAAEQRVARGIEQTTGKISAKRLLPEARAAGYAGSGRNFRRPDRDR